MDEFEDASSASGDELVGADAPRGRSRSSSSASTSSTASAAFDANDVLVPRVDEPDDAESSSGDTDDGADEPRDPDIARITCVVVETSRTLHHLHTALGHPRVRDCLAANDCRVPASARELADCVESMGASAWFGEPPVSDAKLKRDVAGALRGALRDAHIGLPASAAELAATRPGLSPAERASLEQSASTALATKDSRVQALYHVLTKDPLVNKLLGTVAGTAKDAHHLAWSLSTRLGKLELHLTKEVLVKAVAVLIPMLLKVLIHTIFVGSPDAGDAMVVPGVSVRDFSAALFANELHHHMTRARPARFGEAPGGAASHHSVGDLLKAAFNAKFANARGSEDEDEYEDEESSELPPPPSDDEDEASDASDESELRAAPAAPAPPPPLPDRPSPAGEAALERLLAGPAGAATLHPPAGETIEKLRSAVVLTESALAQAQADEAAETVDAAAEAARAKAARRRASNQAAAQLGLRGAGSALASDATRDVARATHAALGSAQQTAIAEAPRLAGGFASALRGVFGRKDAAPGGAPRASDKLAVAADKFGAVSNTLTRLVDTGGDFVNHAGPVLNLVFSNLAGVATTVAEMVAKILASPETQKALSGIAATATTAVGGVAEQAVGAIGKGIVESVKEIGESPDGAAALFAHHVYAPPRRGFLRVAATEVDGVPRQFLCARVGGRAEAPVSQGALVGFALSHRPVGDIGATTRHFVAALRRLLAALPAALHRLPPARAHELAAYVRSAAALAPPADRARAYRSQPVSAVHVSRAVDLSVLEGADVGAWAPSRLMPAIDFLCGAIAAIRLERPALVPDALVEDLHVAMQRAGA